MFLSAPAFAENPNKIWTANVGGTSQESALALSNNISEVAAAIMILLGIAGTIYLGVRLVGDFAANNSSHRVKITPARFIFGLSICTLMLNPNATIQLVSETITGKTVCVNNSFKTPDSVCYTFEGTAMGESVKEAVSSFDDSTKDKLFRNTNLALILFQTLGLIFFFSCLYKMYQKNIGTLANDETGFTILVKLIASALLADCQHVISVLWDTATALFT